jgi:hypothetical protein
MVAGGLAIMIVLAACGGSAPTPTPTVAPTAIPTATTVPTRPPATATAIATRAAPAESGGVTRTVTAAVGTATRGGTTATIALPANPAAVTSAYTNLQRLDSYQLDIAVTGLGALIPFGLGDNLTYRIEANGGNQRVQLIDGSGATQEYYKIGNKTYLVVAGQSSEISAPILLTLPDLLYANLTAQGVTTFTAAGTEERNGRSTTRYNGRGQLAGLAGNPLLAAALASAAGEITGPIWIATPGDYLIAGDLNLNLTAPQPGTTRVRMDVTRIGAVGPITLPR